MQTILETSRYFYFPLTNLHSTEILKNLATLKKFIYTHKAIQLLSEDIVFHKDSQRYAIGYLITAVPGQLALPGSQYLDWGGEYVQRISFNLEKSMAMQKILLENWELSKMVKHLEDELGSKFMDQSWKLHLSLNDQKSDKVQMVLDIYSKDEIFHRNQ